MTKHIKSRYIIYWISFKSQLYYEINYKVEWRCHFQWNFKICLFYLYCLDIKSAESQKKKKFVNSSKIVKSVFFLSFYFYCYLWLTSSSWGTYPITNVVVSLETRRKNLVIWRTICVKVIARIIAFPGDQNSLARNKEICYWL